MLKDRKKVNDIVRELIRNTPPQNRASIVMEIRNKHNVKKDYMANLMSAIVPIESATEFDLFCIIEALNPDSLSVFFTKTEIDRYAEGQYETKELKSVTFDVIRVAEDQYIGAYTVKQLMELRENSLIWYNVNTQRPMTYVIKNGEEEFKISINHRAIAEIRADLDKGIYIPTTITLNINEERDMDYSYKDGKLTIKRVEPFDIIDGFHRYLAMASKYDDENGDFDYPLEIRIVNFPESRAKHFIYQEDKKTKMSKLAAESLNQYDFKNMVCKRLNTDGMFAGEVNVNGKIDAGILSSLLRIFKINTRQDVVIVANKFNKYFEDMVMIQPEIADQKWNNFQIQSTVYSLYKGDSAEDAVKMFAYFKNAPAEIKNKFSYQWKLFKRDLNLLEEVKTYV